MIRQKWGQILPVTEDTLNDSEMFANAIRQVRKMWLQSAQQHGRVTDDRLYFDVQEVYPGLERIWIEDPDTGEGEYVEGPKIALTCTGYVERNSDVDGR
jgi:hypothetical protein